MDYIIQIINGNWSGDLFLIFIIFVLLEIFHRKDISNLINSMGKIKVGSGGVEIISNSYKQRDVHGKDTENLQLKSKKEKSIKRNDNDREYVEKIENELMLEKIYNTIFRSQINMLQEIKSNNNQPMPYQYSYKFFNYHLSFIPAYDWQNQNPAMYFMWLENSKLITGVDGGYILTEFGGQFLKYIADNNYDINQKIL